MGKGKSGSNILQRFSFDLLRWATILLLICPFFFSYAYRDSTIISKSDHKNESIIFLIGDAVIIVNNSPEMHQKQLREYTPAVKNFKTKTKLLITPKKEKKITTTIVTTAVIYTLPESEESFSVTESYSKATTNPRNDYPYKVHLITAAHLLLKLDGINKHATDIVESSKKRIPYILWIRPPPKEKFI